MHECVELILMTVYYKLCVIFLGWIIACILGYRNVEQIFCIYMYTSVLERLQGWLTIFITSISCRLPRQQTITGCQL